MGYYTNYEIDMNCDREGDAQKIFEFADGNKMDFASVFYVRDTHDSFESCGETKWYKHENEMQTISRKFPHILFELHGDGEEQGDLWNEYHQNGKMQRCNAEIKIPPYDASKMR